MKKTAIFMLALLPAMMGWSQDTITSPLKENYLRADNISNAKMVIYNMQGIEVYEKNIPITTIGTQSINIPLSNIIPSGNYIVNLSVDDQVYKKIIIIQ